MVGALLIIGLVALGGCTKNEPITLLDAQHIEYGEDIMDKTFTIKTEDESLDIDFQTLDPEINTMELGESEHHFERNDQKYVVTIVTEDTQMPILSGVEDELTLTGETIDIEEELKKRITAEDVVDGELEVTFKMNVNSESEHTYDIEAKATDKNDNETVETFEVIVETEEIKEVTEKEKIPFETTNKDDASLNKGTTKVSAEGENGSKEVTYEVTYINGEEKSREKMKEEIIKEPKNQILDQNKIQIRVAIQVQTTNKTNRKKKVNQNLRINQTFKGLQGQP